MINKYIFYYLEVIKKLQQISYMQINMFISDFEFCWIKIHLQTVGKQQTQSVLYSR